MIRARTLPGLILAVFLSRSPPAGACATADEPALAQLTAAALRVAALEPTRIRSLLRRARWAALLPHVRARVGRGSYDYIHNPESLEPSIGSSDTWRFEVEVAFSLDRLVFDAHELRAAEAAGRVAEHRAILVERVAALWSERRRIAVERMSAEPDERAPLDDRCAELTALLDAMTDGASRPTRPAANSLRASPPRR